MCASNSHSYTHLILALSIVRKPTVWGFITSNYPGIHDIGLPTKRYLLLCLAHVRGPHQPRAPPPPAAGPAPTPTPTRARTQDEVDPEQAEMLTLIVVTLSDGAPCPHLTHVSAPCSSLSNGCFGYRSGTRLLAASLASVYT